MVNFFEREKRTYPSWVKPKVIEMINANPHLTCKQIAELFTSENNYFLNKNMVIGIKYKAGLSKPLKRDPNKPLNVGGRKKYEAKLQEKRNRGRYSQTGLTETYQEYKDRRKAERAAGIVRESYSDDY